MVYDIYDVDLGFCGVVVRLLVSTLTCEYLAVSTAPYELFCG